MKLPPLLQVAAMLLLGFAPAPAEAQTKLTKPNILWITSEDHGPEMGCYGDTLARTPNVDRLAKRGMIYRKVWSGSPVCAPARTTLITGMYAQSLGAEHMRSMVAMPKGKVLFPQLLREAGYYCSNNAKEDYNVMKSAEVWDESSRRGHWRNRKSGQPFFAVFNSEKSHESKIRARPHTLITDPAKVRVPAYHPDTPEVRRDWAQYYDIVSQADADAGKVLADLEKDGLAEDTIVFYYGDHGSGMPRSKRWPYNSGLHVPLVVYIPEKFKNLRPADYRPGGSSEQLIGFVDFAPTVLSLAGIHPPEWMQGKAFLGPFTSGTNSYLCGARGRMDERLDLVRTVTDGRYVYVRNFMPHLIYGQHLDYMWQTPTTVVWEKLHRSGQLSWVQSAFWKEKPAEELYDLHKDRDEVNNLAYSPVHREIKERMATALRTHLLEIKDVGFVPEGERMKRSAGGSIYDWVRSEDYEISNALRVADFASLQTKSFRGGILGFALRSKDAVVRYWGVQGVLMHRNSEPSNISSLDEGLRDESTEVSIAAAEALVLFGPGLEREKALRFLLQRANWEKGTVFSACAAINSLHRLAEQALPFREQIATLPRKGPAPHERYQPYVPRLLDDLQERFDELKRSGAKNDQSSLSNEE